MKNLNLIVTAGFLFLSVTFSQAQKRDGIKVNLLSPLMRTASFFYEHTLDEQSSLNVGFLYTGMTPGDTKIRGWALTPEYRFYLGNNPAPDGFYVAPYLRYQSLNFSYEEGTEDSEADLSGIGGGLLIGRQWLFKDVVTYDLFFGPSYVSANWDVKSGNESDFDSDSWEGFGIRAGMTLGIRF